MQSAMTSTAAIRVDSFRGELLDVPNVGAEDVSHLDEDPGQVLERTVSGSTESMIPRIFPVYPLI